MAGRKGPLPVSRPTGTRRLLEWGKDLLILGLTCSALFLVFQTPMAQQIRGWMAGTDQPPQPVERQRAQAVTPYALAVRGSLGLYGVSYDKQAVEAAFALFAPLLGEALEAETQPETIQASQWRQLLEAPGVYCVFQGSPPLSVLSAFLGQGRRSPGGSAQALLLSWDGTDLWLAWRDGPSYVRLRTSISYEERLGPLLEQFTPNGAAYAYALGSSDETFDTLDPYVLVSMTPFQPQTYAAASPDFTGDREALDQLLSTLGFQSGAAYESGGELALNESGDRLRVGSQGQVTFHAGEEDRYAVACEGPRPTAAEAASAAWDLLDRASVPWRGEAAFLLTGMESTPQGWTVTFHARLDGLPVSTGEEGWCARFTVEDRRIADFTLTLRSYTPAGNASPVPSQRLAAAALRSLPGAGGRLILTYNDNGGSTLSALWLAQN